MKKSVLLLFVVFSVIACTQRAESTPKNDVKGTVASAAATSNQAVSPVSALARLGFAVFPDPQPIPAFSLPTIDGKNIPIADMRGKYVFLNFWATWCPPCQREMPSIEALYARFGKKNFAILAVSVHEDRSTVEKFVSANKYTFPIVLDADGAVSSMFVGRGIPTTYILDPQGRAVAGMVGSREWDTEEVYDVLKGILEK